MAQREVISRHGFVFHEACWSLLEKAVRPGKVPRIRLFDVCNSLPFPLHGDSISWGHDYGGLSFIDAGHHFPRGDRFGDREYTEPDRVFSSDPYDIPDVERLLTEKPQAPWPSTTCPAFIIPAIRGECFSALPEELCAEIATYLPTTDVLNARLASRAFWPTFHSQQFWGSRFRGGSDRSWLFEAWDGERARDWRWLYRRTNDAHIGPGLQNRKRIWTLILKLLDILSLRWNALPESSSACLIDFEISPWSHAGGDLREEPANIFYRLEEGCRLLHKQRVSVPDNLAQFSASSVRVGDLEYIAGIKLSTATGETIQLGYQAVNERSLALSDIRGFNLAIGLRGIQALQCITGGASTPRWLGCLDDSPKTKRLALSDRVAALEAGFDVSSSNGTFSLFSSNCSLALINPHRGAKW